MPAGREIELKLRMPAGTAARALKDPLLREVQSGRPRTQRLVAIYFDTPDDRLAAAGLALRLRRHGRRWIQTIKGPPESGSGAGVASRLECERDRGIAIHPPALDTAQWSDTPWRTLLANAQRRGLGPRFATDFRRTELPVALDDGTRATVCIDVGEVRDGRGAASPLSEMEVELTQGRIDALYRFAEGLAARLPLAVEPRSKAERGYALVRRVHHAPARAEHPPLEADDSAGAALQSLLRACTRQIVDNADGVLGDDDPEWVHQLRVGTRRLRACLGLLRDVAGPAQLAIVADDARWLARALGPVRDLDVLALETLPAVRARLEAASDASALATLTAFGQRVGAARDEAREAARAAVASPRYTRLVLGAGALAATPLLGASPESHAARMLRRSARDFAAPWLERRHRKLLRRARGLATANDERRHEARLAAKRLRYVVEFFAAVFPREPARAYRRALARLQDALGAYVDQQVAVRIAHAMEGARSPAAAILQSYAEAQSDRSTAAMLRCWKEFRGCKRFFD
ncbi:MAG TPA: CYTH and CHAD domain-containing protein [Casimicrobiaceae bacterium]|jgi:inorganic triphosphatase YgiF